MESKLDKSLIFMVLPINISELFFSQQNCTVLEI